MRKITPRWIVLLIDSIIGLFSILTAYLLRFNFDIPPAHIQTFYYIIPVVLLVRVLIYIISGQHKVIVRHASTKDAQLIFITVFIGSLTFLLSNFVAHKLLGTDYLLPTSVILIDFFVLIFSLTFFRLLVKTLYLEYENPSKNKSNVVIYGTGQHGLIAKRTLERDKESAFRVIAFLDDSINSIGTKLENVVIRKTDQLEEILSRSKVSKLIIADDQINSDQRNRITDICLNHEVEVQTIPEASRWINGELSLNQIRKISIEDLLERDPIHLDEKSINREILNQTILITGAAGSIGSELARQITRYNPKKLILFDKAESELYDLELELAEILQFKEFEVVIGDITNAVRMENVFSTFKPSLVLHAAAYKHVPIMENNPSEAILVNVQGTRTVANLASKYKVRKFIMISTDKAVKPTNVMGASKRIAEIYIQSFNKHSDCNFVTTRFGNVLGSNGSVIPRFRQQIENGGPVTVTHPEVTRYFMTIPEACQLVLEAGAMGKGGEIYIFDMGKSVKIIDLAHKMIKLSGLDLGRDIQVQFTGLRPGEKLYEELINEQEHFLPTHHPQILIADVQQFELKEINDKVDELMNFQNLQDNTALVTTMKSIMPEFISNNSIFEELDSKNKQEVQASKFNGRSPG
jgi:FlaA1/EpsC-like NDP-sugar epimerase